ncbi:hypothetical protein [Neobacillus niacini]|uniref:hypothetical protein n=1 Tax=Neobacillus niacini TaxID=86668 RepID=UPI002867808E|nr:hypothetical protein [Neobacillus niacini]MDR7001322.1 hypothetical protein [Neobacillus niacini]
MNLYLGLDLLNEDNINVKSALLHMIEDAMASAGVIVIVRRTNSRFIMRMLFVFLKRINETAISMRKWQFFYN